MIERDMPDLYYIQDKRSFLGNSPMWWAKDGKGYTAYIMGAERLDEADARAIERESPDKYRAFKCSEIDARLHLVFDAQDISRLGTDEPCGWPSGYVEHPLTRADHPVLTQCVEALQTARNGLEWYQTEYPLGVNDCDHEAMQEIDQALAAFEKMKEGV